MKPLMLSEASRATIGCSIWASCAQRSHPTIARAAVLRLTPSS